MTDNHAIFSRLEGKITEDICALLTFMVIHFVQRRDMCSLYWSPATRRTLLSFTWREREKVKRHLGIESRSKSGPLLKIMSLWTGCREELKPVSFRPRHLYIKETYNKAWFSWKQSLQEETDVNVNSFYDCLVRVVCIPLGGRDERKSCIRTSLSWWKLPRNKTFSLTCYIHRNLERCSSMFLSWLSFLLPCDKRNQRRKYLLSLDSLLPFP